MRKNVTKQFHVGSSKHDFSEKPYGFCCDVNDRDVASKKFPSPGEPDFPDDQAGSIIGPDIKFCVEDVSRYVPPRSGILKLKSQRITDDRTRGRIGIVGGQEMICKRCRGPLQWFLEDEIDAARDLVMNRRQEEYSDELKRNIRVAKEKERQRNQRKKK